MPDGSHAAELIDELSSTGLNIEKSSGAPESPSTNGVPLVSTVQQLSQWLLTRRWFSRIWVLQEVAMAKEAIVVIGSYYIAGGSISLQGFSEVQKHESSRASLGDIPPVMTLGQQLGWKPMPLQDLLIATASCGASDPRDKVFALPRLAENVGQLAPNYRLSVRDVFRRATLQAIRRSGNVEILSLCSTPEPTERPS